MQWLTGLAQKPTKAQIFYTDEMKAKIKVEEWKNMTNNPAQNRAQ